ncbi:Low-affinity inorganic phosphate transporter [Acidisarcina polymorpha]|uniref:Phosphate transporter n=1 Tax=Acidisarcina polymorpha TaxID=2211140 RepID=A0A2Z5G4H5_9BACT|nr:inorganic phosphate transporter [Acidisarcina polymorpha]AXC13734.1 Low-affinity inorganic phosphate transporter [Acidisarcina polymorpha]
MAEAPSIAIQTPHAVHEKLNKGPGTLGMIIFGLVLVGGFGYAGFHLATDLEGGGHFESIWPYVLLGVALLTALGFEFVNGFHDTANAVATVIYTHSLEPHIAVVWSGMWNLIGVLTSSGAVAFTIISLLPVELILQVGHGAGFAMVFSLLISAIMWNLGTWWFGLPASSSHTLVGSIIGVGLANQLMSPKGSGTSGVDWAQAGGVFRALLVSPLVGFGLAFLLLLLLKALIKIPALYKAPEGDAPPPFWIRALLILTCTGVSFGHGSNDGQKGMGLIMLILIGTVPTVYALNHAVGTGQVQDFAAVSQQAAGALQNHVTSGVTSSDPRADLTNYIRTKTVTPVTLTAAHDLALAISTSVTDAKSLAAIPANQQQNVRNDMYVEGEALRLFAKNGKPAFNSTETAQIANYRKHLDTATKFIPTWVKVAVALALGLGTMVGWKRIVVTVGEKIGKDHLTYAQGASAEIVAAITIIAADQYHLPVSTTHVLSSGVAGTMLANGSGLQMATIRNIALAWICTLPAAALLSAGLFWILNQFVAH